MPHNINHGWGRVLADSVFASRPSTGRKFLVIASTNPNWSRYTEMLPLHPEGDVTIHATIDAAVDATTAGENATIYVAALHSETVTAAGTIVIDKGGLNIVGLGNTDDRPRIDFDTATTADLDVNASNTTFENIKFNLVGIDLLAAPLDVNAANCTFKDCEFVLSDATNSAVTAIVTDANASGLKLKNCNLRGTTNTGTVTAVRIVGGKDHLIEDTIIDAQFKKTTGCVSITTTAAALTIRNSILRNRAYNSTAAIDVLRDSTVVVAGCAIGVASGTTPITVNEAGIFFGKGSILTSGNWYRGGTTVAAGTLL